MAKVTIKAGKPRTKAKQFNKVAPKNKPTAKPKTGKAYMKPPTSKQDKAYNSKQM